MRVVLKPLSGTVEANVERAKAEVARVLSFRGDVTGANVEGSKIIVKFDVNAKWDLTPQEKVSYLKDWIPAKVKSVFRVLSVSEENHSKPTAAKGKKTTA
jgi:lipid-binding SYLF domain-containing protein